MWSDAARAAAKRTRRVKVRAANVRLVNKNIGRIRGFVTQTRYPSRNGPTYRSNTMVNRHGVGGLHGKQRVRPSKNKSYSFRAPATTTARFLRATAWQPRRKF